MTYILGRSGLRPLTLCRGYCAANVFDLVVELPQFAIGLTGGKLR